MLEESIGTLNDDDAGNLTKGTVIYDNQAADQAIYENALEYFNLIIDNKF